MSALPHPADPADPAAAARPARRPRRARPATAVLGLAALAATVLAAGPARAEGTGPGSGGSVTRELAAAYAATARYADERQAVAAGYVRTDDCVAMPGTGGMGYHYTDAADLGSTDPARPTNVIYATGADGRRRLVAVEWIVRSTGQPAPVMFGRPFDGPFPHARFGRVYDRHVWLYEKNPAGLFARYNPRVTCP
ncbi:hypothetical protein ACIRQY_06330 [Streptomyces sp. NPDC101490]|uniref:hypothetical protein n=1 Tax=Streptomyces sp. NPDC101490 TaxID=3366143 RepID=UPI0037FADE64